MLTAIYSKFKNTMAILNNRTLIFLARLLISLALFHSFAIAEFYRYKDENGRWVFSDKKPVKEKASEVEYLSGKEKSSINDQDSSSWIKLNEQLFQKYKPRSPIEAATLAVVKIETILGLGSGFFVSASGHIITNRHVIRPQNSTSWQQTERRLEQRETEFKRRFQALKEEKENLKLMKKDLDAYKDEIENPHLYRRPISKRRYDQYTNRYKKAKSRYNSDYKKISRLFDDFKKRKTSLTRQALNVSVARSVTILFKDGSKAKARIVNISSKKDLALLKLDGYITPFLRAASLNMPLQASKTYAIGSPLGQSDSITAGIVTRIRKGQIITDATVLSGNSGGPLIDSEGHLLGVNTQKFMADNSRGSEGFGIAIPVSDVFEEFGNFGQF